MAWTYPLLSSEGPHVKLAASAEAILNDFLTERDTPRDKRQRRRQFLTFLALLSVFTLLIYSSFLTTARYLIYYGVGSDSIGQTVPFFLNAADRFSELTFSTWNPSQFLGSTTIQLFNPEYFVSFFGREALPVMMLVSQLAKVILAGVFFYLFLGYYRVSYRTRVVASLGIAFCGRMLALAPWTAYTAEVTLLAALLWAIERAITHPRKLVAFPVTFALIVMVLSVYGMVLYTAITIMYASFSMGYRHPELDRKAVGRTILRLLILYACGVLLSCPALLPYLDAYGKSARVSQDISLSSLLGNLTQLTSPELLSEEYLKALSPSVTGFMESYTGCVGFLDTPNYYCGVLALMGLPFAFCGKTTRQRVWLGVILLFTGLFFISGGFRFLLGGAAVESDSFRMSSTWVIFVIALVGAIGTEELWARARGRLLLCYAGVLIILALVSALLLSGHIRPFRLLLPLVVIAGYTTLLLLYRSTKRPLFVLLLALAVPIELLLSGYRLVTDVPVLTKESYDSSFNDDLSNLLEEQTSDNQPSRVDYQTDLLTSPMANSYLGTESYIGGIGSFDSVTNFMKSIGNDYIETLGYSRYTYGFSDPSLNAILGVRYTVYPGADNFFCPLGYQRVETDGYYQLFENPNAPGFFSFFPSSSVISKEDYLSMERGQRGPLLLHSLVVQDWDENSSRNFESISGDLSAALHSGSVLGDAPNDVTSSQGAEFSLAMSESKYIALRFDLSATSTPSGNIRVRAEFYRDENDDSPVVAPLYLAAGNEHVYLPVPNEGYRKVKVWIVSTNACDDARLSNVGIEEVTDDYVDYYESGCAERASANATVTQYSNDAISAEVTAPEDGMMLVPIPKTDSWHVSIDGNEVETFVADLAFIGFEVPQGNHVIQLTYKDESYGLGVGLFALSSGILAGTKITLTRRERKDTGKHFGTPPSTTLP